MLQNKTRHLGEPGCCAFSSVSDCIGGTARQTSLRTGVATFGSLKDKPQPFSRCFACSGSKLEACLLSPGMASGLTLLTVGKSTCVRCFLCAGCAGINCFLVLTSGSCEVVLMSLIGCADTEPLIMFLRAVVIVRPRALLVLLPAGLNTAVTGQQLNDLLIWSCQI